jgi:hypothetical protein
MNADHGNKAVGNIKDHNDVAMGSNVFALPTEPMTSID